MTFNQAWMLTAKEWVVTVFVRFWLWVTRNDTIVCRGCGQQVLVEMLEQHTLSGCLNCGETKLQAVKRD